MERPMPKRSIPKSGISARGKAMEGLKSKRRKTESKAPPCEVLSFKATPNHVVRYMDEPGGSQVTLSWTTQHSNYWKLMLVHPGVGEKQVSEYGGSCTVSVTEPTTFILNVYSPIDVLTFTKYATVNVTFKPYAQDTP